MNRRGFFKATSWILLFPIAILAFVGIRKDRKLHKLKEVFIPANIAKNQSFYQGIIISKLGSSYIFLSNKCTHLGCSIAHTESDRYICSCHGSQFDLVGEAIKGPATKSLTKLEYRFIPEKNGYLVFEKA